MHHHSLKLRARGMIQWIKPLLWKIKDRRLNPETLIKDNAGVVAAYDVSNQGAETRNFQDKLAS